MNSNFRLHEAGQYWIPSCTERKLHSSIPILLDVFVVMYSNRSDISTPTRGVYASYTNPLMGVYLHI